MRKTRDMFRHIRLYIGIGLTVAAFLAILAFVLINGLRSLDVRFLFSMEEGEGLLPPLLTTLVMVALSLLIALPAGVGSAIYLNEYAKPGARSVRVIRIATETLAGIPSILYGLFGFLFFVMFCGWSWSILAGALTLSIMVLPTVIRTTEETLGQVPASYREASYALGAGKLRTILRVVLPSALSGILVAVILAVGRIVAESAALILTAGTIAKFPSSLMGSGATLAVFMYTLSSEGLHFDRAYATAIVLMLLVFSLNLLSKRLANRFRKG